jgi:PAS domain S-box-containing protein
LEKAFSYDMPFLDLLIFKIPPNELGIRIFETLCFALFSILIFNYIAKAKESENRYHQLFDSINDAVFVISADPQDDKDRFIEVNNEACKRLGYSRAELLKLSLADVDGPEDVPQIPGRLESLLADKHLLFETVHVAKDGRQIPVEVNAHLVDFKGKPASLAIARDVTARRQAQEDLKKAQEELEQRVRDRTAELTEVNRELLREIEEHRQTAEKLRESELRFRTLFQTAGSVIIVVDTKGRIQEINGEAERILGWQRQEVLGKSSIELLVPEEARNLAELGRRKILGGQISRGEEFSLRLQDGSERLFLWNSNLLHDSQGQPLGIIAVGHDITKRKEAEKALMQSEQKLHQLATQLLTVQEDQRRRLSQELHEEMGQTLLAMKLRLSAIKENLQENSPKKQKSVMEDCDQLSQYLQGLVDNIRRLSRDLSPAILEDLGLPAAIRNLCDEFCLSHKNIEKCICDIGEINGILSQQDQINIYRIVQESFANIAKHSDASKLWLTIKKQNNRVSFELKDNGKGFEPDEVLFQQSSATGLGLTALDERVRILGGTLRIDSRKGEGTRVSFDIPARERSRE